MERFVEENSPGSCLIQRQHLLQRRKSLSCNYHLFFFEAGRIFWGKNDCTFIVFLNPSLGICFQALLVTKYRARKDIGNLGNTLLQT